MRAFLVGLSALAASACSDGTPPGAYQNLKDRVRAATGYDVPCFRTVDGIPSVLSDAECYRLGEPERLRGVAIVGFEISSFFPDGVPRPTQGERLNFWLSTESVLLPQVRACSGICTLHLDFIGRRTVVEGNYGHMGGARHMVVVDRIVAVRSLD